MSKDKCRSTKVSAWEMAKTAAERVRLPQQPYKNTQTAPTTTHGRSNQQASAEMTPLALSSVSCKFKVNLLEPRQLEPKGLRIELRIPSLALPSLALLPDNIGLLIIKLSKRVHNTHIVLKEQERGESCEFSQPTGQNNHFFFALQARAISDRSCQLRQKKLYNTLHTRRPTENSTSYSEDPNRQK